MNARKIKIAASFAAATLALSGCNVGNAETPTPSPSIPTSTASQTPAEHSEDAEKYKPATADGPAENVAVPKMPGDAKEYSEEGAAAFAIYYFELLNYTIEANNPEIIEKATSKDCKVCEESIIKTAASAEKTGKWQVGGKHHPSVVDSYISGENLAVVTVEYTADASQFYLIPNEIDSEFAKLEATQAAMGLKFDGQWKVYRIIGVD